MGPAALPLLAAPRVWAEGRSRTPQGGCRRESVRRAAHAAATVCGRVAEWEVAAQPAAPAIPNICAAGPAVRVKARAGARQGVLPDLYSNSLSKYFSLYWILGAVAMAPARFTCGKTVTGKHIPAAICVRARSAQRHRRDKLPKVGRQLAFPAYLPRPRVLPGRPVRAQTHWRAAASHGGGCGWVHKPPFPFPSPSVWPCECLFMRGHGLSHGTVLRSKTLKKKNKSLQASHKDLALLIAQGRRTRALVVPQ